MADQTNPVNMDEIHAMIVEHGYVVDRVEANVLRIQDCDSGIVIRCVLEDDVLFSFVTLDKVPNDAITPALMRLMLDADNGITTSGFQLYEEGAQTAITLSNFCKLSKLCEEDQDDILACLEFLVIDAYAARELTADIIGAAS